ncbi:MAG: hypothetical protein LC102_02145 [Ignavibacteriales bacterium]|nr:hypothetical protein [Ignavibacteria bacterium]MBZ0196684.1 hypothetical protein [Ignavibacteriaceae bacterium]MCZ2142215.1 hypothetical protein [Ignavibacteriales bacterium]WKZ71587.1 MAG: hypothetical protein QY308_08160 [Ignavibacteriaceae bacterium]
MKKTQDLTESNIKGKSKVSNFGFGVEKEREKMKTHNSPIEKTYFNHQTKEQSFC